jgi:predicted secreted protein
MAGRAAYGVKLERSDMAATPVFTPIANMVNLGGPEMERETIDVTAHDSPNSYREFIGSLIDAGEVSVELNYEPEDHDVLIEDFEDTEPRDYRITWPGGQAWQIKALLTGFSPEGPHDDKLAAEVTLKVTGKPEIIPAGGAG